MGRKPNGTVFEKPAGSGRYAFAFLLRSKKRYVKPVPATGPTGAPVTYADAVALKEEAMRRYALGLWDPEAPGGQGAATPAPPLTVAGYGVPWAEALTHTSADAERRVMEQYIVPSELGAMPLAAVTPPKIAAWVAWLGRQPSTMGGLLAPGTVRGYAAVLKRMFLRACFEEKCPSNPFVLPRGILPPIRDKVPGARRLWPFTRDEVEQLISDPEVPLVRRVIYAILFLSGARVSEMTVLRWSDYDPAREPLGCLTLERGMRKTRKSRTVKAEWVEGPTKTKVVKELPVHATLAAVLAEWKLSGWALTFGRAPKPHDRIVPSENFTPRAATNVRRQLHADLAALKMRLRRTHGTRHSFITLLLADGADETLVRKLTHPLPEGTERDSFQRYRHEEWARLCAEVAKLRIVRRAEVLPLWRRAAGDGLGPADSTDIATECATGTVMTEENRLNPGVGDAPPASTPNADAPDRDAVRTAIPGASRKGARAVPVVGAPSGSGTATDSSASPVPGPHAGEAQLYLWLERALLTDPDSDADGGT
jgi:integrase